MGNLPDGQLRQIVLALFAALLGYQLALSIGTITWLAGGTERAAPPFSIPFGTREIRNVAPQAFGAGVQDHDQLLELEGRPFIGHAEWARELRRKHAGETMNFVVNSPGSLPPRPITIPLTSMGPIGPLGWTLVITIYALTQICALLLGFTVLFIRPRDPMAWLLLLMLISFASFSASGDILRNTIRTWPNGFRQIGMFYHVATGDLWSVCMLLFGIYFAGRDRLDIRAPWLKWLFIAPLALNAVADGIYHVVEAENIAAAAGWRTLLDTSEPISNFGGMAAISVFFHAIWRKSFSTATSPDVRRRLRLVAWGSTAALTPLFVVAIQLFALHGNLSENAILLCTVPLAIFPLTLAYVIVVHRALDVRVVIRQGLQYALAQRGIRVIQLVLTLLVIGWAVSAGSQHSWWGTKFAVITCGVIAIVFVDKAVRSLSVWTDRRFFREAHSSELILNELNESVRTIVETGQLLETVAHKISESLHVARMAILLKSGGDYQIEYAGGYATAPSRFLPSEGCVAGRLKRERKPQHVYLDNPQSWIYSECVDQFEHLTLRELDTQLLLPLAFKGRLEGVIALGPKLSEEPYAASDLRLLESVATQAGMALENSRLTEAVAAEVAQRERTMREMEIAKGVQERLFPQRCPNVPGLDCVGRCRPALDVGGDYYDWLEMPEGGLAMVIGDVSGKGVPAALLMASLQASFRAIILSGFSDLSDLMGKLNLLMYDASPTNRFATSFCCLYEPWTGQLRYSSAGHNPALLFRGDASEPLWLRTSGIALGLRRNSKFEQAELVLGVGDRLVLYTDGVTEARNPGGDEFGEQRLADTIRNAGKCARRVVEAVMDATNQFAAGSTQHDDITVIAAVRGSDEW